MLVMLIALQFEEKGTGHHRQHGSVASLRLLLLLRGLELAGSQAYVVLVDPSHFRCPSHSFSAPTRLRLRLASA